MELLEFFLGCITLLEAVKYYVYSEMSIIYLLIIILQIKPVLIPIKMFYVETLYSWKLVSLQKCKMFFITKTL